MKVQRNLRPKARLAFVMARLRKEMDAAVRQGKMTVAEMSKRTGISRMQLYDYLKGKESTEGPLLLSVLSIMGALEIPPERLFGEERKAPASVRSAMATLQDWVEGR